MVLSGSDRRAACGDRIALLLSDSGSAPTLTFFHNPSEIADICHRPAILHRDRLGLRQDREPGSVGEIDSPPASRQVGSEQPDASCYRRRRSCNSGNWSSVFSSMRVSRPMPFEPAGISCANLPARVLICWSSTGVCPTSRGSKSSSRQGQAERPRGHHVRDRAR